MDNPIGDISSTPIGLWFCFYFRVSIIVLVHYGMGFHRYKEPLKKLKNTSYKLSRIGSLPEIKKII